MASSTSRPPRRLPSAPFGNRQATTFITPGLNRLGIPAAVLALSVTLTGCGELHSGTADDPSSAAVGVLDAGAASGAPGTTQPKPRPTPADTEATAVSVPAQLPGLGPQTLAEIPKKARQVVLVTGRGKDSPKSQVVLYRRTSAGWEPGATWPAHNALKGWTDDHRAGDLHSPIGVFTLTDAGGLLADPGTKLPYDQSRDFTIGGTGFEGEPLAGSFDYVVAINYNRKAGATPLDWTRPLGTDKGGGIWLHVDHGGPTQGCVSLAQKHMKELLLTLDPDQHPVIVMGDADSLKR
ncbi:L,D-transpeptidase family protein [Streptomyces sp. NPDC002870]|uniref:L,D-transpeptidase family protein n=1 Tax=Streptomyces sp. NPDC002870 TaxID=3364666 RepID=UPI0036A6BEB5